MSTAGYARWCFRTDKKRFKSMGHSISSVLEATYQQKVSTFTISNAAGRYMVDFDKMQQKNLKTGFVRPIERQVALPPSLRLTAGSGSTVSVPANNNSVSVSTSSSTTAAAKKGRALKGPGTTLPYAVSKKGKTYRMTPSMLKKKLAADARREERRKKAEVAAATALANMTAIIDALPDQTARLRTVSRILPRISLLYRQPRNAVDIKLSDELAKMVDVTRSTNSRALRYDLCRKLIRHVASGLK